MEHGAAGEGLTEVEKKASLEVSGSSFFLLLFLEIFKVSILGCEWFELFFLFSGTLQKVQLPSSFQAISRKSKRRVHYQKFVKVISETNNLTMKETNKVAEKPTRSTKTVLFPILYNCCFCCPMLI